MTEIQITKNFFQVGREIGHCKLTEMRKKFQERENGQQSQIMQKASGDRNVLNQPYEQDDKTIILIIQIAEALQRSG